MKIGGTEVPREKWDEADHDAQQATSQGDSTSRTARSAARSVIPDWTRTKLPEGAPPARTPIPAQHNVVQAGAVAAVGA